MSTLPGIAAFAATVIFLPMARADAAELTAHNLTLMSGETSGVVVSGRIAGELTFGVNIMVEIVPRAGATGVVRFTPAPPVDIVQLGDPWPGLGVFNWFDTDVSYSETLNGSVDGDGCCAPGCNATNDSDCTPICGNGVVEAGETCDGD